MCCNDQKGAILIGLVIAITLMSVLGTGIYTMTTSSTFSELLVTKDYNAYHLAKAGMRYAEYKYPEDGITKHCMSDNQCFEITSTTKSDSKEFLVVGNVNPNTFVTSYRRLVYNMKRHTPTDPGTDPGTFVNYVINENVFVYGETLSFAGGTVSGSNATVVIRGDLSTDDINMGASISVSTIYIDGDTFLSGGSAGLGSSTNPGEIFINGNLDLWTGSRNIYGDVYVNGNFRLKDARIHGNVYVQGDVEIGWTPWLSTNSRVYYTGTLTHPASMSSSITDKFIKMATVPGFTMPDYQIPGPKSDQWYADRGYVSSGTLVSGLKIFADSYSSTVWRPTAENVVIVSKGDITITGLGGSGLTGVLFAPYGKVTFNGSFFRGTVIARDGFFVTSGGTTVTFLNIQDFFPNPADIPISN